MRLVILANPFSTSRAKLLICADFGFKYFGRLDVPAVMSSHYHNFLEFQDSICK
jgi:hypothetical protein